MRIDFLYPYLPPYMDAIGQYSVLVASALAREGDDVRILCAEGMSGSFADIKSVPAFVAENRRSILGVERLVAGDVPDWFVIQYNPFSYGRWGFNPYLIQLVRVLKSRGIRVAVMFHECHVPREGSLAFRVMYSWQHMQFQMLCSLGDVLFFSTEQWMKEAQENKGWRDKAFHLPVPSCVPNVHLPREEARDQLGINRDALVLGYYGTLHPSRCLDMVRAAVEYVSGRNKQAALLYIGPQGRQFKEYMSSLETDIPTFIAEESVSEEEVSRRIVAMDLMLSPFIDGVSTRRSSVMTGLQHGIAVLGTKLPSTDSIFLQASEQGPILTEVGDQQRFSESAAQLSEDVDLRQAVATHGQVLYDKHLALPIIVSKMSSCLYGRIASSVA